MSGEPRSDGIDLPAHSRHVALARNFVADLLREAGWTDDDQLDDLRLLVSEAVTNAVRAQAARDVDAGVRLDAALYADRVEIVVADTGGGFDTPVEPPELPEPDIEREGGFGLPLIEALSDEAEFIPTEGGTTVRVVVYRDAAR